MSGLANTPRLIKGALIGVDLFNPLASIVIFQYNPDTMTRRLEPRTVGGEGEQNEAFRLSGPPKESISLAIEIDATDQLERADPITVATGIGAQLAALEMMLYPKVAQVIANMALAAAGSIEVLPETGPMILFVWGPSRVLPVRLTSLAITEEAYDTLLNPLRAKVELSLEVLSYNDLKISSPGNALFLAHQTIKEVLATTNSFSGALSVSVSI